jgi:hypothetical protein
MYINVLSYNPSLLAIDKTKAQRTQRSVTNATGKGSEYEISNGTK